MAIAAQPKGTIHRERRHFSLRGFVSSCEFITRFPSQHQGAPSVRPFSSLLGGDHTHSLFSAD